MKDMLHRKFLSEKSLFYHRFIGTSAPHHLAKEGQRRFGHWIQALAEFVHVFVNIPWMGHLL